MELKQFKIFTIFVICCIITALLGLICLKNCCRQTSNEKAKVEREVKIIYDTTFIDMPRVYDSIVVRYVTAKLPIERINDSLDYTHNFAEDSVTVEIPITQKEYSDTTYHAWVSGYMANLDSIAVYNKTEYIKETILKTNRKRWGFTIGPTIGGGWNGEKISPYIGIGITWGWSF